MAQAASSSAMAAPSKLNGPEYSRSGFAYVCVSGKSAFDHFSNGLNPAAEGYFKVAPRRSSCKSKQITLES